MENKPTITYSTKVGKILSRQKNPDRITLVSIFKPQSKEQREHGVIYFIIEILSNDPTIGRVAKLIEKTVIDKYYENLGNGLESFEEALKAVNEKLADIVDEGEIGWIGKINSAIAILEKNILHITQTGTVEAYLIRDNKITHITENLSSPSERPNPLKTYVNIASGDLKPGDKVILSTSELFYHFALDDLRRINARFSPAIAATYIVKMLRKEEIESINTLILELNEEDESTSSIGKRLLLEEKNLVEQYNKRVLPAWRTIFSFSKKGVQKTLEKTKEVYGEKIAPGISQIKKEAGKKVNERMVKLNSEEGGIFEKGVDKGLFAFQPKNKTDLDPEIFGKKSKKSFKKSKEKEGADQRNIFEAPKNTILSRASHSISQTYSSTRESVKKSKKKSQLFMTLAVLLIMVVVFSGIASYQKKRVAYSRESSQQAFENLKTKVEGAIKANELGDTKKAQTLLEESQNEIKNISLPSHMKAQLAELETKVTGAMDEIFNIQRINDIDAIADFSQLDQTIRVDNLVKIGNLIYATDKERFKGVSYDIESKVVTSNSAFTFDGTVEKITPLNDKSIVALLTSNPDSVYIYSSKNNQTERATQITEESWPRAKSIASYMNNIYLLAPTDGQIYKYTLLINSYSGRVPYIIDKSIDLTSAVDIAIDGYVYILLKNGDVMRFVGGERTEFGIHGLPSMFNEKEKSSDLKMLDPIKIVSDAREDGNLYIVDKGAKRIVVFDKEGAYKTQYISDKWADLKDFWIDGNAGYILSGTKLYQIEIR